MDFMAIDSARRVLGLSQTATLFEVKKAYRTLAKKWHPDTCVKKDSHEAEQKTKEITQAYQLLLSYIEKYRYSFSQKKFLEDNLEARFKAQFSDDPLWSGSR